MELALSLYVSAMSFALYHWCSLEFADCHLILHVLRVYNWCASNLSAVALLCGKEGGRAKDRYGMCFDKNSILGITATWRRGEGVCTLRGAVFCFTHATSTFTTARTPRIGECCSLSCCCSGLHFVRRWHCGSSHTT